MLERLKLHLGDRFELGDFILDSGEPGNFVLSESGQADIMASGLKFFQHANEAVLVDLGQLGEMIVREHVGKRGLFARVILEVHRDLLAAEELRTLLGTGICLNVVDIDALEAAFSRLYGNRVYAK